MNAKVPDSLRRRGLVGLATLVVASSTVACGLITSPLPSDAELFAPPAVYTRWWAMTEACSGRTGDLETVRWYRAPASSVGHKGQPVAGFWRRNANLIVLAEESVYDGATVRHEMLHALLQADGHPREQFLGACASVVRCQGICVEDSGPWRPPQPGYAALPPDSLRISAETTLLAREADGQRWLTLQIAVRNPREHPVVVAAPGDPVTPPTFAYDLRGPTGGIMGNEIAMDSSVLSFEPFEVKRWLFEFQVASELTPYTVVPGVYVVSGGYARRYSERDTIMVSP